MELLKRSVTAFLAIFALTVGGVSNSYALAEPKSTDSTDYSQLNLKFPDSVELRTKAADGADRSASKAAAAPITCGWTGASVSGSPSYETAYPTALSTVGWTGTVNAQCSGLAGISVQITVTGPPGFPETVAQNSCGGCTSTSAINTSYTCLQGFDGNCAGAWTAKFTITFTAPGDQVWLPSPNCTPSGKLQTCTFGGAAGSVQPYKSISLPDGVNLPELDARAIADLRTYHFPGGAGADSSKSLFRADLTDSELQTIFRKGMTDSTPFVNGEEFYYQKVFPYPKGFGNVSLNDGGAEASRILLAISEHGDVITMYPVL